jgi:hypothetical protein
MAGTSTFEFWMPSNGWNCRLLDVAATRWAAMRIATHVSPPREPHGPICGGTQGRCVKEPRERFTSRTGSFRERVTQLEHGRAGRWQRLRRRGAVGVTFVLSGGLRDPPAVEERLATLGFRAERAISMLVRATSRRLWFRLVQSRQPGWGFPAQARGIGAGGERPAMLWKRPSRDVPEKREAADRSEGQDGARGRLPESGQVVLTT